MTFGQGQEMTLTFNTHISNVKAVVVVQPGLCRTCSEQRRQVSHDAAQIKAEQSGVGIKVIVFNISS